MRTSLPAQPKTRLSIHSKKSGNAANVDYVTAREHLLAKIVPDEEPPAASKLRMRIHSFSLHVETMLLLLLHVLLLLLRTGKNYDKIDI